jgi:hypothetical protein
VARPAPVDEGSPARLIAAMVGIVGILLLGSLAWSAVGALFSAMGEAASTFTSSKPPPPRLAVAIGTPSAQPTARATDSSGTPVVVGATQTPAARATPGLTSTPLARATPLSVAPTPDAVTPDALTPTPSASGRAPWVLLPQPAPGARVAPGPQVIEARGRGDTAITAIRLELDGTALGVALEQRSESTWRGSASTQVAPGHHAVRATVIDDQGRTGSFRWTFDAGP